MSTPFATRRGFLGTTALASLLSPKLLAGAATRVAPKAKRIIHLFMHGGPPQMELFDPKPDLIKRRGEELPESVRKSRRLTGMTSGQKAFPIVPGSFRFEQHGQSGAAISELLPHLAGVADELCFIKSMHTEAINHDPAVTYLQTGHQQPGRPSFGAWLSYGLGSENRDLPAFVVLLSNGSATRPADPLHARLWGPGFLPSNHQGVQFRSGTDPVLYLSNPPGINAGSRAQMIEGLAKLNREQYELAGDPEILTRTRQFEMAGRMQMSVPELTDLSNEPKSTRELYGSDSTRPGSFARNCVLARRLAERGVRFIQLYHRGWDQHYNLPTDLRLQCGDIDRACAGLVRDLRQRGLLEDTLIVWTGEFGRTIYSQGTLEYNNYGRDHHGGCFSIWLAGGGIKPGVSHGSTDEFSFNVAENGVHVHDLNATLLRCLGINHERLTFRFQGRYYRLTDVHGHVVNPVLA
ncbi:MAG: sulfatase [Verrucomicrobiales bacterium]|nr:sulfatase [Verrucomicrobiales bacterium]|tara:strand:+ start:2667 stop:4058 length:1392 start_codon:yes stop_codon:yes gene_type:complete